MTLEQYIEPKEPRTAQVTVRLPKPLLEQFRQVAQINGHEQSQIIVAAIKQYIAEVSTWKSKT